MEFLTVNTLLASGWATAAIIIMLINRNSPFTICQAITVNTCLICGTICLVA